MKLFRLATLEGPVLATGELNDLRPLEAVPAGSDAVLGALGRTGAAIPESRRLLAPSAPSKIVAIGLNYRDHIREAAMDEPTAPLIFTKFPSSLTGPHEEIVIDTELTQRVDWEVELAVVVGRRMRDVPEADALDYVFAYTTANDVSARDVQFGDGQWVRGKSLDTFCPLGPGLVTADEIDDPQDLKLTTRVNARLVQDSSTAEMVFGVAEILSYCSRNFTLEPGDLVLTGTPWGCGEFMDPPVHLQPGDVCACEVGGIGAVVNDVVARSALVP